MCFFHDIVAQGDSACSVHHTFPPDGRYYEVIGRTRKRMMSSSVTGHTKGKESFSFTKLVFTTVVSNIWHLVDCISHTGQQFLKAAKRWLSLAQLEVFLCVPSAWFIIKKGKNDHYNFVFDLVIIYPVGTIHECNYYLPMKLKYSWVMLLMFMYKRLVLKFIFRNCWASFT